MKPYKEMTQEELASELEVLRKEYKNYQKMDLKLDMSRGKPCIEQLDLSMGIMDALNSDADLFCEDGTDCRNYGGLDGIQECKELIGDMMENHPDNIIIYGNSLTKSGFFVLHPDMTVTLPSRSTSGLK